MFSDVYKTEFHIETLTVRRQSAAWQLRWIRPRIPDILSQNFPSVKTDIDVFMYKCWSANFLSHMTPRDLPYVTSKNLADLSMEINSNDLQVFSTNKNEPF